MTSRTDGSPLIDEDLDRPLEAGDTDRLSRSGGGRRLRKGTGCEKSDHGDETRRRSLEAASPARPPARCNSRGLRCFLLLN